MVAKMPDEEPRSSDGQPPSPGTRADPPAGSGKGSRLHDAFVEEMMNRGMSREEAEAWFRRL